MTSYVVELFGEKHELTMDNTMVYLFPSCPEMNHVHTMLGDLGVSIRDNPNLCMELQGYGFPYCYQPTPRKTEVDAYADWVMSQGKTIDQELEDFDK